MRLSPKQIEAVTALSGPKRYEHFIKVVVDQEEVWGLDQDGWALAATNDDDQVVFPLWPAREYAELCAREGWEGYEPLPISLEEFVGVLLPELLDDGILPCIFYLASDQGVIPTIEQLLADLSDELDRYE
ncbi:MAG: DUF2750 domain-containing protein [Cyanobacteria bacterium HKST-UBA02]|nr:DUF2750 domain-containing protein [Cyanobacteria bacterium HKST-UBA02]